jgi:carboxyl-terminal processing protease
MQTFGKGTVQSIFELGDGAALKLTVSKYYTPKGRSIQAEGIHPDIIVDNQRPENSATKDRYLREKDLKGHLEAERTERQQKETKKTSYPEPETNPPKNQKTLSKDTEDYQKSVALDYLKGRQVLEKNNKK